MIKNILIFLEEDDLKDFDLICKYLNIERSFYIAEHIHELKERLEKRGIWKYLKK